MPSTSPVVPNRVFPILVGSGRSGTTLFRNILDSHPDLAVTHEAHFIAPLAQRRTRYETEDGFDVGALVDDLYANANFVRQGLDRTEVASALSSSGVRSYADAVRVVYRLYADGQGKSLYGDKTPGYVTQIGLLGGLFPEAHFIHIIRDGRDVALAYLDRSEWGPATMADAALYWASRVSRGRAAGRALGPDRYLEVRYEDMVDDPERVTTEMCAFLGLTFDPVMMQFHEKASEFIATTKTPEAFTNLAQPVTKGMRDWRTQMEPDDVVLFEAIAGDLLASLGYDTIGADTDLAMKAKVMAARARWQGKRVASRVGPMVRRRVGR